MAAKTSHLSLNHRPSPTGVWGYFWIWSLLLMLAAAFAAPAVHAQAAPAADAPKLFGEHSNLKGQGQAAQADPKAPAYLSEDAPLQLKDYEEPKPAAPEPWWQQLLGFIFKLAMVLGLIVVSLAAVKKLSGGRMALNLPNTKGRNVVVLETTHLSPQQAIHMVSLGGERLLVVGAGPQGLTTLTEITDPAQVSLFLQAQKSQPTASSFNQVFDLEQVVQETNSELLAETFREVGQDPRYNRDPNRRWPGQ